MKRKLIITVSSIFIILGGFTLVNSLSVGQVAPNLNIRDADDKPATIPDYGTKVLTIIYPSSDVSDVCDPISDALKAKNYPKAKYAGIGIANMKDSTAPDWLIRKIVRGKIQKYSAVILTDPDLTTATTWGLGNCKGQSVVVVIGADKKVKYINKFNKKNVPTQSDIDSVVSLVDGLVK
ncbi:MAG: YtfJ family protein [Spirochaetes bacterium]|nr:YtfJ family protein [Spirochaetota bacterium]